MGVMYEEGMSVYCICSVGLYIEFSILNNYILFI